MLYEVITIFSDHIEANVVDPDTIKIISTTQKADSVYKTYYKYSFGINYVEAGLSEYNDEGYFISEKVSINGLKSFALDVEDYIPKADDSSLEYPYGSIEYTLYKSDYNESGVRLRRSSIPILPLGLTSIDSEPLYFKKQNDVKSLRFIGHTTSGDGSEISFRITSYNVCYTKLLRRV